MSRSGPNLLDEALGLGAARFVLVEDRAETSGAFVLHHLLKRSLSASRAAVVFVALAHPFSHYDRILRKLGCNLSAQKDAGRLHFVDLLNLDVKDSREGFDSDAKRGSVELFQMIQKAVQSVYTIGCTIIMIDDISLLEIAAHGFANHVLDILHYCATLTSGVDGSIIAMNHTDIYSKTDSSKLLSHLECLADMVIEVQPLATGLAEDVHGQSQVLLFDDDRDDCFVILQDPLDEFELTVIDKRARDRKENLENKVHNFHFKVRENGVDYFCPGKNI